MGDDNKKCKHYNIGYCKYHDKGCNYMHPTQICDSQKCTNKYCPMRHPRECKYRDNCKFIKQERCAFKHKVKNTRENTSVDNEKSLKRLQEILKSRDKSLKEKEEELSNVKEVHKQEKK